jgi:hypothetical protein
VEADLITAAYTSPCREELLKTFHFDGRLISAPFFIATRIQDRTIELGAIPRLEVRDLLASIAVAATPTSDSLSVLPLVNLNFPFLSA